MSFNFKTSQEAGDFLESVYQRVHARNRGVLSRAALFLALGRGLPERYTVADSQGVEFQEDTVVGDELGSIVRAAINYRVGETLSESKYRRVFKQYVDYGCLCMKELWEESGSDLTLFISALLKETNCDESAFQFVGKKVNAQRVINQPVKLSIIADEEPWVANAVGGNAITIISGSSGRGKSQLALDLLAQVSRQGVRFLFFDLKGELEESPENKQQTENRTKFLSQTGAEYTRLVTDKLPINPLFKGKSLAEDAQISTEIAGLVRCFAHQLSASQERAIRDAFDALENPDLQGLVEKLEDVGVTGEGLSLIEKLVRFNLFSDSLSAIPINDWLLKSQVINFKPLGSDNYTKSLVVAFILNTIMKQLNQALPVVNNVQPLQMILFIDEAHLLLPKEGKSGLLGQLARQGRSWGFPVWLASQDADKFITTGDHSTNFADLANCGIHFSPELLTDKEQKTILGKVIPKDLNKGETVLRIHGKTIVGKARQYWKDQGK